MNIAILSRRKEIYSTRRLVQAAAKLGHSVVVLDPLKCHIHLDRGVYHVYHRGKPLEGLDVILPRIGASVTEYGLAVVRQFELMGVPTVNSARAIARSRDKLRCLQMMADQEVHIPKTYLCRSPSFAKHAIALVGGLPVILKLQHGTQGIGVILADSYLLVIGDRVVAAMRRVAQAGEFRSNLHRGGTGEPVQLTPEQEVVALKAVRVLGLEVAGVDLLEGKNSAILMEVNSSPGIKGLEKATGKDIAQEIIECAVRLALAGKGPGEPQGTLNVDPGT
ncbi:MAG: 30S ribosomal protein S6--L-glutamate ligase [Candidatus Riflebacteria bacterium]|nr:30S ribosomal protein S6--L-glutamate ligase [Candidatus Riflebacteria bacterium]